MLTAKPKTPSLTAEQAGATSIRIMGEAGPLRMFSETAFSGGMSFESQTRQGFAGAYFCDSCSLACDGVYRVGAKWVCDSCKAKVKPPADRRKGQYPEPPSDSAEDKTLQRFASKHKLKITTDEDATRMIPGRHGQIYEHDLDSLGIMYWSEATTWPRRCRSGEAIGMVVHQDGDREGTLLFNPSNLEHAKMAIDIAGVKRKKSMSAVQKESLAKARSRSPLCKPASSPPLGIVSLCGQEASLDEERVVGVPGRGEYLQASGDV
jgi:hypothetical protein